MSATPAQQTTPSGTTTTTTRPTASPSAALERLLPQDIEAERAVLGSMLLEREAIGEVITVLREAGANALKLESHQQLYDVLVKLYVADQPIDGVVVKLDSAGAYQWEPDADLPPGNDYSIRIGSSTDSALFDVSAAAFGIERARRKAAAAQ